MAIRLCLLLIMQNPLDGRGLTISDFPSKDVLFFAVMRTVIASEALRGGGGGSGSACSEHLFHSPFNHCKRN